MKMKKRRIDFAFIFIFAVIVIAMAGMIVSIIVNEGNRITSGIVVDKQFNPSYSYADVSWSGQGNSRYYYDQRSDRYSICIQGEKDGKTVRYWFSVTEEEYIMFHIGDYYSR